MANLYYDFWAGQTFTPYIGAGRGPRLVDSNASLGSTVFAYQGIIGVGWECRCELSGEPRRPVLRHDQSAVLRVQSNNTIWASC